LTPAETSQLLRIIQAVDKRDITDANVVVWGKVLQDVTLDDAKEAALRHFQESTEYLMPIHVLRGAAVVTAERRALDPMALAIQAEIEDPPAQPGDQRRGVLIVQHVMGGLARARRVNGGNLGRKASRELGDQLMADALRLYPAKQAVRERKGAHCGRSGCQCTHDVDDTGLRICDGGWLVALWRPTDVQQVLIGEEQPTTRPAERLAKCPSCDWLGAEITGKAASRRIGQAALRQRRTRR
jgi:hypothetical protein